jgi:rSAM/selenodomain-associated transferase 2
VLLMLASGLTKLSVVIPIGPDELAWPQLLSELCLLDRQLEIILVACQPLSDDIELPVNVACIQSPRGRAKQLNAGARLATRDFIWFLHADSRLTSGVLPAVQQFIAKAGRDLGYFQLKFANDGPKSVSLNAWAANVRSRLLGLPFGDQGFIMHHVVFDQVQGFDENISLGEDLDFVVRLQASHVHLQELPAALVTSARRYQQYGWLMTSIRHVFLTWQLTRQARQRLSFDR